MFVSTAPAAVWLFLHFHRVCFPTGKHVPEGGKVNMLHAQMEQMQCGNGMKDTKVPGRSLFRRDGKKNLKALPRSPGERLARVIYDSGDFTAASILTDSINTRSAQISWELIKNTWMPLFLCQVAPKSEMLYSTCSSELNQFGERKWAPCSVPIYSSLT